MVFRFACRFTVILCLFLGTQVGLAATITVDGTQCTLIDAVTAANTNTAVGGCTAGAGADTLELGANITLVGAHGSIRQGAASGLPDVVTSIAITSAAGSVRSVARNPQWGCSSGDLDAFRLINVGVGGALTLRNVSLSNGCVAPFTGDAEGGAILVDGGALTLDHVSVIAHRARSRTGVAAGGAIAAINGADVHVDTSTFENNIVSSDDNLAGGAHSGSGYGGAFYLAGVGSHLVIGTSLLTGNQVVPGSAESGGLGCGGAIALQEGTVSVRTSLLRDNIAHGGGTTQTTPGIGRGGGICQAGGALGVIASTLQDNQAVGGSGLGQYTDGAGIGGGLAVMSATQSRLENVTLSGNRAIGGNAITRGYGGGVALETAGVVLARVTIAGNQVQGYSGTMGAGLWLTNDASIFESLLSGNTGGADCTASTPGLNWSAGYNLIQNRGSCTTATTDLHDVDPLLAVLADNGCSATAHLPDGSCVPTRAIGQTGSGSGVGFVRTASPALDTSLCLEGPGLTDARGVVRPQEIAFAGNAATPCDIGAFEASDSDSDGITNEYDQCLGNDASGDADGDHVCTDRDDDDSDPAVGVSLFADGFELRN